LINSQKNFSERERERDKEIERERESNREPEYKKNLKINSDRNENKFKIQVNVKKYSKSIDFNSSYDYFNSKTYENEYNENFHQNETDYIHTEAEVIKEVKSSNLNILDKIEECSFTKVNASSKELFLNSISSNSNISRNSVLGSSLKTKTIKNNNLVNAKNVPSNNVPINNYPNNNNPNNIAINNTNINNINLAYKKSLIKSPVAIGKESSYTNNLNTHLNGSIIISNYNSSSVKNKNYSGTTITSQRKK
jgi:hypothetical protein